MFGFSEWLEEKKKKRNHHSKVMSVKSHITIIPPQCWVQLRVFFLLSFTEIRSRPSFVSQHFGCFYQPVRGWEGGVKFGLMFLNQWQTALPYFLATLEWTAAIYFRRTVRPDRPASLNNETQDMISPRGSPITAHLLVLQHNFTVLETPFTFIAMTAHEKPTKLVYHHVTTYFRAAEICDRTGKHTGFAWALFQSTSTENFFHEYNV